MSQPPKKLIKLAALWMARSLGLFALSRHLTRKGLRILCYHGIWMGEGHFSDFLFMSAGKFRSRMAWLRRSPYPVLPLDEALQRLAKGTLPDYATVITIDDGWYGTYTHMVPSLCEHGLPATLYVSSYYVEKQLPVFNVAVQYVLAKSPKRQLRLAALGLNRTESFDLDRLGERNTAIDTIIQIYFNMNGAERGEVLQQLAKELEFDLDPLFRERIFHLMTTAEMVDSARRGVDIQLHTHRHRLDPAKLDEIGVEIQDNRASLSRLLPGPFEHFCYPSGVWSPQTWNVLRNNGIKSATTTEQGFNYSIDQALGLKRLLDGESLHELEMEAELSGFMEIKRRLTGKASSYA